ncbi:uncharacterized protein FOMMEDRAFT_149699 [Fomitiporia mediterranea MF3/22]|uniref:uncharacterized protein n=1 Tax=Fomitiporia mediterranea (strain MF3/22) TaxID=694068 RepID=UPI00044088CC|nr:uncharacterized protein FOMMEDRAFT_149699 [Fomitiporia mediterranea MF3/22]EJD07196.1 hypothetical protein FOMMEDRAFT_149699 [Fomitiporia mediterranea MF3/22]
MSSSYEVCGKTSCVWAQQHANGNRDHPHIPVCTFRPALSRLQVSHNFPVDVICDEVQTFYWGLNGSTLGHAHPPGPHGPETLNPENPERAGTPPFLSNTEVLLRCDCASNKPGIWCSLLAGIQHQSRGSVPMLYARTQYRSAADLGLEARFLLPVDELAPSRTRQTDLATLHYRGLLARASSTWTGLRDYNSKARWCSADVQDFSLASMYDNEPLKLDKGDHRTMQMAW